MLSFKGCSANCKWSFQAKCFLDWLQQFDNCIDQLFAIAHSKKKCNCHRIINTLRQTKKGRYSALEARAAPQQSSYKASRPNSPVVVFSREMFSQSNCRHSYKHWWYHREIFTRKKEASKYLQAYAFSWCLEHSPFSFTRLWSDVWKYNIHLL